MDITQSGETAAATFSYWEPLIQGVATAVSGVAVGALLLLLNRRFQRKDAASVIQQRLESLSVLIAFGLELQTKWSEEGDSANYDMGFYEWVPEANALASLLADQQFAVFPDSTRSDLFTFRYTTETQIEMASTWGVTLHHETNRIESPEKEEGSAGFAAGVDHMAEELRRYQKRLWPLSAMLSKKYGAKGGANSMEFYGSNGGDTKE